MVAIVEGPIGLSFDNFTPYSRTPWAGSEIYRCFKQHLPGVVQKKIGESWEFSCDPLFPSYLDDGHKTRLIDFVETHGTSALSQHYIQHIGGPRCDLLVKIINADAPLSLQVHPHDNDPSLEADECGKPESWLVLDHTPGAGVYLGFKKHMTREELRKKLHSSDDLSTILQFVPVKRGDYFEIDPGIVHAIGPGVTLLEPQRVISGQSGKTYRMWDWNRFYDEEGQVALHGGNPRQLHIDEALRLVDPPLQVGDTFVDSLRRHPANEIPKEHLRSLAYSSSEHYQVFMLEYSDRINISFAIKDGFGILLNCGNSMELSGFSGVNLRLSKGQSAFLPHAGNPYHIKPTTAPSNCILITSGMSQLTWL